MEVYPTHTFPSKIELVRKLGALVAREDFEATWAVSTSMSLIANALAGKTADSAYVALELYTTWRNLVVLEAISPEEMWQAIRSLPAIVMAIAPDHSDFLIGVKGGILALIEYEMGGGFNPNFNPGLN